MCATANPSQATEVGALGPKLMGTSKHAGLAGLKGSQAEETYPGAWGVGTVSNQVYVLHPPSNPAHNGTGQAQ